ADTLDAERSQARAQLAAGLVREGHRHELRRREGTRRDLVGEPPGDRRRLARAGPGEDADRAAHRLDGAPLLRVQTVERIHGGTVARLPAGNVPKQSRTVLRGAAR